jgi:predicted ATP-binding protein involved in virulence
MRIEELHLKNFCSFKELDINFPASNLAVFIGNNGAGKTSILKSITLLLSWLIARIEREKGSGSPIADLNILNGTHSSEIKIKLKNTSELFEWSLAKTAKGKKKQFDSKLADTFKLANIYRTQFTENDDSSFPLIIYYPVERSVLDVPLKIRTKHNFSQLDGYDNALSQGVDFRRFFEWFREREDIENESLVQQSAQFAPFKIICKQIEKQANKIDNDGLTIRREKQMLESLKQLDDSYDSLASEKITSDIQLNSVRNAINNFLPDFKYLRIQRNPRLRMLVNKTGIKEPLNVLQLSQGEKSLMALVGDIARRLAMMNPTLENPLHGTGIVLIDEIEMHLHPCWQRSVITNLQNTFPNCQFIITTHSPQILSCVHRDDIFILKDNEIYQPSSNPIGRDSNDILSEIMEVTKRPKEIQLLSDTYFSLINKNLLEEAQEVRKQLLNELDRKDPIFIRADAMISRKNLLRK